MLAIHLIYHDFVYYKYNALCLLKIFINNFINNKKINRRNNLQIKNHKIKNYIIILYFLLRLYYEILKRWKYIDFLKHINLKYIKHFY